MTALRRPQSGSAATGVADPLSFGPPSLGSVRAVVDARGNVREARDYYPFGLQMPGRVYVQGSETREGFTGHERAADTLATETEDLLANALIDAGGLDKTVAFAVAAEALQAARDTLLLAVPAAVAAADEGRPR